MFSFLNKQKQTRRKQRNCYRKMNRARLTSIFKPNGPDLHTIDIIYGKKKKKKCYIKSIDEHMFPPLSYKIQCLRDLLHVAPYLVCERRPSALAKPVSPIHHLTFIDVSWSTRVSGIHIGTPVSAQVWQDIWHPYSIEPTPLFPLWISSSVSPVFGVCHPSGSTSILLFTYRAWIPTQFIYVGVQIHIPFLETWVFHRIGKHSAYFSAGSLKVAPLQTIEMLTSTISITNL
jgi:hypothetical protein